MPHEIPDGSLVTVPLADPRRATARGTCAAMFAKLAVTVVAAFSVIAHVPVPLHPPPLQPVKVEPAAALAVRVTGVPLAKLAEQVAPQSIPAGLLVAVPEPVWLLPLIDASLLLEPDTALSTLAS